MTRTPHRTGSPGLPRGVERYLVKGHGTAGDRIKSAMVVRAAGVLLRRHPRAVADAMASGLVRGARVGVAELRQWLREQEDSRQLRARSQHPAPTPHPEPSSRALRRLSRRDRRRLIRLLERDARRTAEPAVPALPPPAGERPSAPEE